MKHAIGASLPPDLWDEFVRRTTLGTKSILIKDALREYFERHPTKTAVAQTAQPSAPEVPAEPVISEPSQA